MVWNVLPQFLKIAAKSWCWATAGAHLMENARNSVRWAVWRVCRVSLIELYDFEDRNAY